MGMPMVKSLGEKVAEINRMVWALCRRNPEVRALRPLATVVNKAEGQHRVRVSTQEGPLRIHSCAAKSANRFWIATTLKYMAAEKRAAQLLEEQHKRELANRYAAVWR
jgi:hypothetical protein